MMLGYLLVSLALIVTIITALLFVWSEWQVRRHEPRRRRSAIAVAPEQQRVGAHAVLLIARLLAVVSCLLVVAASGYLVFLIATHHFEVAYVADYSARHSDQRYLLAAFWGGQEGSILLWAFWTSVLGALLAFKADGKEARLWPVFALVQATLLVLVLVKSPFRIAPGPVPTDGQGLSPLLENQWMVVHPPILFLGFASLAIPWAWAVYGLIYRDWDGWLKGMYPWALFAFAVHGFGIALGGYWAYETLGWGGFWGWDPVEVSSLVPWLFLIALLHGALIQRANGGFKPGNFLLASLPFAFMCYGTFLTRTGILADFSVHSFSSLGKEGFDLLLGEVSVAALLPVILLAVRYRSIAESISESLRAPRPHAPSTKRSLAHTPSVKEPLHAQRPPAPSSDRIVALTPSGKQAREFGLFIASIILALLGVITAAGMSAPLITKLWIPKGAGAQPEFYNQACYPLTILMFLMMAVTPYLSRRSPGEGSVDRRLVPAYAGTLALTFAFFALGGRTPWMLLLFAMSAFTTIANVVLLVHRIRRSETTMPIGGFLAHVGAALTLTGIACLVAFSHQALHVMLVKGQPTEALGYKLTYLGMTSQPYDRSNALRIRVEKDGRVWEATPHLFIAPFAGSDQLFANPPDIRNFGWGDLYLAHYRGPSSLSFASPNNGMSLHPNDTVAFGDYRFDYHGLKWSDNVGQAMSEGVDLNKLPELRVHALVDVTYQGRVYPIRPELVFDQVGMSRYSVPAALPGAPNAVIALNDAQFPSDATLTTSNLPDPMEMVEVDLSTKPMIWLVWLGTILYTIGGLVAYRRRALEVRRSRPDSTDGHVEPDSAEVAVSGRTGIAA